MTWQVLSFICSTVMFLLFVHLSPTTYSQNDARGTPSERAAEVIYQDPKISGSWGCRCSLDPAVGRLQRHSGEHWDVLGCMLLNLPTRMFHKRPAGKSEGAKRKVRRVKERRSTGGVDDIDNTWGKMSKVLVLWWGSVGWPEMRSDSIYHSSQCLLWLFFQLKFVLLN